MTHFLVQDNNFETSDRLTRKGKRLPADRLEELEGLFAGLLEAIGEDRTREGLAKTPARAAHSFEFLTQGYRQSVDDVVNNAIFASDASEIVMVKDIELYSMCEHHLLPFIGRAHVAYIPDGKVIGLSKVARIVDVFARRLQIQEQLTTQIAEALMEALQPMGVAVVIEAKHLCMMMRGVAKQNSVMKTSSLRGVFKDDARTRSEFLSLLAQ
ncbi:MAG TPA: GTP cyclohydrolase I FolE [Chthoniobacterales bacterium]|jgi:GTP cyclohydrolase I